MNTLISLNDRLAVASLILGACFLVGCGSSDIAGVHGIVKLDGEPIPKGSVTFTPQNGGALAYAEVQSDGSYELQSGGGKQGLKPGSYVATVSYRRGQPSFGMTIAQIEALEIVPIKYTVPQTSDLTFQVQPGQNEIDIEMSK